MAQMEGMDKFLVRVLTERMQMSEEVVYLKNEIIVLKQIINNSKPVAEQAPPLVSEVKEEEPVLDTTQPPLTLVKKGRGRPVGWRKKTTPSPPA